MKQQNIKEWVRLAGGARAIASDRLLCESAIYNWISRGKLPAEHCPSIERLTGGVVRCEQMRPDVEWSVLRASGAEVFSPAESAT